VLNEEDSLVDHAVEKDFDKHPAPIDEDDDEGGEDEQAPSLEVDHLESKLEEIERRAAAGGLRTRRLQSAVDGHPIVEVFFAEAESRRDARFRAGNVARADELLGVPFEEYRAVPGYSAIYSPGTGDIEARVRTLGFLPASSRRQRPPLDKPYELVGDPHHPGRTIRIAESSGLLSLLSRTLGPRTRPLSTFQFHGFGAQTPAAAKSVLDDVGSALVFGLDLAYGVALEIAREEEFLRRPPAGRERSVEPPSFPRSAYDPEPVALYMYGRDARGMPLLQFLAYYQAVEFYFPRYAEGELRRQLEAIVKDPRFNPHRDRDIGRLLGIAVGDRRRSIGSERDQLKTTIRACLQADDIREFVTTDDARAAFFADRRSPLTGCTIALRDQTIDVRDAAANRVYDLRCKIVHTKDGPGEEQIDLLLPNSPEARLLHEDIALLELIATRVIVASSRELVP
jgi:hypothetical protein